MKIAFNIDYDYTKPTGIGRYGIELIKSWNQIGQESELWKARNTRNKPLFFSNLQLKTRHFPFPRRITNYFWPALTSKLNSIKWVHSSNGMILKPTYFLKQVAMVHDLVPFRYGSMKAKEDTEPWRIRLTNIAKYANCITVNSTSTMNDLLNIFPEVENKVFLTPLGIDHFSAPTIKAKEKKHILAVGTVEPRKNIDGLLRAYSILNQEFKDLPPLVIAGMNGFKSEEYKQLASNLNLIQKVEFTGFVSETRLASLYSEAYCLVHPAHHEGFGFTIPEAFNWNLPVVSSNVGGIIEFFSETAWMVNPSEIESIAIGIKNALELGVTTAQYEARQNLKKTLTWNNCASKTLEAIKTMGN